MASGRAKLVGVVLVIAAVGVVESASDASVVYRLRRRSVEQSVMKKAGLDEVISVLLKMMGEFRDTEKSDKENWEEWQEQTDESQVERNEYVRAQEGLIMQNQALENAKKDVVANLIKQIGNINDDMKETRKSIEKLTELRKEESEQHQAALADMTKTIESVSKAIEILEGHYSVSGAMLADIKSRVQYAMSLAGTESKPAKALTNLMQAAGPDWLSTDGSKYNSFDKQSGAQGVIATLNDLRSALDQNKQDLIENENASRRQYEETKAAKEKEIRRMKSELEEKTAAKGNAEAAIAMAQATTSSATQNAEDAKRYLAQLKADVVTFTAEFQERARMRDDEIAATQAALDALQAVSAGAKDGVGSFLQMERPHGAGCARCQAEGGKLESLASTLHSAALAQVAGELRQRAQSDYSSQKFEPVVELLRALVERLQNEQSGETSHHEWCETEKTQSVTAKEERERNIKVLQSEVERLTVSVDQLKGEITFLGDELTRVDKETKEATSTRESAHDIFMKARADHEEVIAAVGKAIKALEGQYGLVQTGSGGTARRAGLGSESLAGSGGRASPFEGYESGDANAGSAMEMLQDLLSRYTEARTLLVSDENKAASAYKALFATNKQFILDSRNTRNAKLAERRGKIEELKNDKDQMKAAFTELQELATYLQELRPKCDDIRSTYDERKRRREAEIAALQEVLDVLSDPSAMGSA